jgi:hypothetical protein
VPGVVAEEAELAEDHRQVDGDRQLPPRVAQKNESRDSREKSGRGRRDFHRVVPGPAVQQAGGFYLPQ